MKTTIEFDDLLYRQLKSAAALRGRTVKDLVAEGVKQVLNNAPAESAAVPRGQPAQAGRPDWFGSLQPYAKHAGGDHTLAAMRASIARGRRRP